MVRVFYCHTIKMASLKWSRILPYRASFLPLIWANGQIRLLQSSSGVPDPPPVVLKTGGLIPQHLNGDNAGSREGATPARIMPCREANKKTPECGNPHRGYRLSTQGGMLRTTANLPVTQLRDDRRSLRLMNWWQRRG